MLLPGRRVGGFDEDLRDQGLCDFLSVLRGEARFEPGAQLVAEIVDTSGINDITFAKGAEPLFEGVPLLLELV